MNKPTTNWLNGQDPKFSSIDELRSPPPSLLDAIREQLTKPGREVEGRTIMPFGTVVMTPDGSAIRSVITGRLPRVSGFYTSRKAGRALPYESMNEQALLKRSEVDTSVVDYRAQLFRFELVIDGAKRIYIADCVRLLGDGSVEVLEVKGRLRPLPPPEYVEKLKLVREICDRLGWKFRILSHRHLYKPDVVYANIDLIQSCRTVRFDQIQAYRALELIERAGGEAPLGQLSDAVAAWPLGLAMAQAMMVRRLISIDLTRPLNADSKVTAVPRSRTIGRGVR
jgi:hypothetical protein